MMTLEANAMATKLEEQEFGQRLATVIDGEDSVTITRHGKTVGFYLPVRKTGPTAAEVAAFHSAATKLQAELAALGISEDELVQEFDRARGKSPAHP